MNVQATVQTKTPKPTVISVTHGLLQRCTATQECDECRKKREATLQRAAVNNIPTHGVPPIVHEVLRSPGQPLDAQTRAFMEPRFGHDFSQCACAYGCESSQFFTGGECIGLHGRARCGVWPRTICPRSHEGQRLIAHEIVHVVQQNTANTTIPSKIEIGHDNDQYEQQADTMAQKVSGTSNAKVGNALTGRLHSSA